MVPLTGIEPVRMLLRGILSPLCLPIPPQRRILLNLEVWVLLKRLSPLCLPIPPFAVPDKNFGLTQFLDFIDRGTHCACAFTATGSAQARGRLRCPIKSSGLRNSSILSTAAHTAPALSLPPAARRLVATTAYMLSEKDLLSMFMQGKSYHIFLIASSRQRGRNRETAEKVLGCGAV